MIFSFSLQGMHAHRAFVSLFRNWSNVNDSYVKCVTVGSRLYSLSPFTSRHCTVIRFILHAPKKYDWNIASNFDQQKMKNRFEIFRIIDWPTFVPYNYKIFHQILNLTYFCKIHSILRIKCLFKLHSALVRGINQFVYKIKWELIDFKMATSGFWNEFALLYLRHSVLI